MQRLRDRDRGDDDDEQERGVAAGRAGVRLRRAAAAGLQTPRAVRVLAHRVGHQPGHPGPHAAAAEEGQPPYPVHHPQQRGQGEIRQAVQDGRGPAVRRGDVGAAGVRAGELRDGAAPPEAPGRRVQGVLFGR